MADYSDHLAAWVCSSAGAPRRPHSILRARESAIPRTQRPVAALAPPPTRRQECVETLHGVEIRDPYRWLENEDDPEVQRWVEAQNRFARQTLARLPERASLRRRVRHLLNVGSVGPPVERGGRVFFTRQRPGENQPLLRLRRSGRERTLLDPNRLSAEGTIALDWWYPSPDGRLLAYGLSTEGDEQSTLQVLRVDDGVSLPERIPRTRAASIAWLPDASGFYYTRYPVPGEVSPGEEHYHRRVFFHRLGGDPASDPEIFTPDHPQGWPGLFLSPDGRFLLIVVAHGWSRSDVFLLDRAAQNPRPRPVVIGEEALFDGEVVDGTLYLRTNLQAPNYRVLAVEADDPRPERWREVVPESENVLAGFTVAAGRLALHRLVNASSRLELRRLDGAVDGEVPLPTLGSVIGMDGDPHGQRLYFGFTSFALPASAYVYRLGDPAPRRLAAPRLPAWLCDVPLEIEQVRYPSRDGTLVSMFVLRRPDTPRDGERPTLLTGYGGFNVSRTPAYSPSALAWIERGGVWALANLRGGGEYGEAWHRAGMLDKKQNVFDDFIAAAEWLIAQGYTRPERLAISGGSNGGLLVGAAITQRPELFRAAVCMVPLLDMLRYHRFRIARLWIPEYGSADDPEQFRWLYAYSPYHRVRRGARYPAVLLTTGEKDSRVDPLHARKMAALLQVESGSGRPVLLRVERQAGHGAGKPLAKLVEEQADALAFLRHELCSDGGANNG